MEHIISELKSEEIFAKNLRYLRKKMKPGISQKTLSRVLHLPPKTIMNYETQVSVPSAYAVLCISKYFGCTMEAILTQKLYKERTELNWQLTREDLEN